MRFRPLFSPAVWLLSAAMLVAAPFTARERSVSASHQFIVYSTDTVLRSRVTSFAEEVKSGTLKLLGVPDRWKHLIVITLEQAEETGGTLPPVSLNLVQNPGTYKVEINVRYGNDPAAVNLQKQIVRAVLMEIEYRAHPEAVRPGKPFVEAPWWLTEGMVQLLRKRNDTFDGGLFKRLLDANKLPTIAQLTENRPPGFLGSTLEAIDQSCAMCLVQLLIDQPGGKANLIRFIEGIPVSTAGTPLEALQQTFPSLAKEENMDKWWTLQIARLSAVDRFTGLNIEDTETELAKLLRFELPINKQGAIKTFALADYEEFLKIPESKAALAASQSGMLALGTKANALFRGILVDYEQILASLLRGKTRGLKERILVADGTRVAVLKRSSDVTDYMNWFEGTQMTTKSGAFDSYMRAAHEMEAPMKRTDPVTRYLDQLEQEF